MQDTHKLPMIGTSCEGGRRLPGTSWGARCDQPAACTVEVYAEGSQWFAEVCPRCEVYLWALGTGEAQLEWLRIWSTQ